MPEVSSRPAPRLVSQTLDQQMKLYSAAALAAGVSALALASPAKAEVVITKQTIAIPVNSYFNPQNPVPIDINHDGVNDFSFSIYSFAYHSFFNDLNTWPLEGGAAVGKVQSRGDFYASALARGANVGPSAHFSSKNDAVIEIARGFDASSKYSRRLYGNWGGNPPNRYVGVKFLINGETHYGWVRLTVTTEPRGMSATITAYAYETVANKRILAGISENKAAVIKAEAQARKPTQPSLGMLALGSDGLPLWRREETPAVTQDY